MIPEFNNHIECQHPRSSRRSNIMLCYPLEMKRIYKWKTPLVIIQPKLDGERCRAVIEDGEVQLYSSESKLITSVPHINDTLLEFYKFIAPIELDGELYIHNVPLPKIQSIVSRTVNLHEDYERVQFHIFDHISNANCMSRLLYLDQYKEHMTTNCTKIVPFTFTPALDEEIFAELNKQCENGYEGIVIRNPYASYERKRTVNLLKFKPYKTDVYEIINVKQEQDLNGNLKQSLGAVVLSSDDGETFSVGSGFTSEQRQQYWQMYLNNPNSIIGKTVTIKYQGLTHNRKVPYHSVFHTLLKDNAHE